MKISKVHTCTTCIYISSRM